jgi:hypothetical protein
VVSSLSIYRRALPYDFRFHRTIHVTHIYVGMNYYYYYWYYYYIVFTELFRSDNASLVAVADGRTGGRIYKTRKQTGHSMRTLWLCVQHIIIDLPRNTVRVSYMPLLPHKRPVHVHPVRVFRFNFRLVAFHVSVQSDFEYGRSYFSIQYVQ